MDNLEKRFTDEHERPEIVPDEMRAATQSILDLLHPVFTPQPSESMTGVFRSLVASLSPEEAKKVNSWHGIPVAELRPELQAQATHLLYMDDMNPLALRRDDLNKILVALPGSRIMMDDVLYGDGKTTGALFSRFPSLRKLTHTSMGPAKKRKRASRRKIGYYPAVCIFHDFKPYGSVYH